MIHPSGIFGFQCVNPPLQIGGGILDLGLNNAGVSVKEGSPHFRYQFPFSVDLAPPRKKHEALLAESGRVMGQVTLSD